MPGQYTSLHRSIDTISIGPAVPHGGPRVGLVGKVLVQLKVLPPVASSFRVVPEHLDEKSAGHCNITRIDIQRVARVHQSGRVGRASFWAR